MNPDQIALEGSLIWVHAVCNLDNNQTRAAGLVGEVKGHCMTVSWVAISIYTTFMPVVGYMRVWAPNIASYTMWGQPPVVACRHPCKERL